MANTSCSQLFPYNTVLWCTTHLVIISFRYLFFFCAVFPSDISFSIIWLFQSHVPQLLPYDSVMQSTSCDDQFTLSPFVPCTLLHLVPASVEFGQLRNWRIIFFPGCVSKSRWAGYPLHLQFINGKFTSFVTQLLPCSTVLWCKAHLVIISCHHLLFPVHCSSIVSASL
jgi:hypothetical protein